jgi:hypothetical protein
MCTSTRFPAHFGQWLDLVHRGRKARKSASGSRTDLWAGEKKLPAAQADEGYACDAPRNKRGSQGRLTKTGFLGAAEHRFYRASESDRPSWGGSAGTSHLGHGEARPTTPGPPGMVASLLSRMSRPHASLRVALVQPRERGGKLLAQRDLQRTEALAAGRTSRRWTVREVLSYPLPPVPLFTL